jgi:hypothetical protein
VVFEEVSTRPNRLVAAGELTVEDVEKPLRLKKRPFHREQKPFTAGRKLI